MAAEILDPFPPSRLDGSSTAEPDGPSADGEREETMATPIPGPAPATLAGLDLTPREQVRPSPVTWRDQILYFLLPDRFSDGGEAGRPGSTGPARRSSGSPTTGRGRRRARASRAGR
nr:hypothetical protein GCM10020093_011000 [Planobispora longispora]